MRMLRILFSVLILACSSVAFAQFPVVTSPTATPIPGAGHDYLKGPAETVNPVSGSVSIRIPVIMPPGRGVTLPFSFAYDSGGANYIGLRCNTSGPIYWLSLSGGCNSGSPFSSDGWSETVPTVTHTIITWTTHATLSPQQKSSPLVPYITCRAVVGFVYQDAQGNRHNLGLTTYSDPGGTGLCTQNYLDWPAGFTGQVVTQGDPTQGADGSILATMSGTWQNPYVTITNADGSNFSTTSNGVAHGGGFSDRYGNTVGYSGTTPGPGYNYVDTTQRTVLQDSGFGVSPETVTISGLGAPYTVNWTTVTPSNFNTPVTVLQTSYPPNCPNPIPHQGGGLAVSTLTLPNRNTYTFTYDPTYGVVSKMIYPTGGYVRYVWGMNIQAEQSDTFNFSGGSQSECNILYGTPAVTDRYVSYDGATEVLHQTFNYSTTWPSNPNGWTSKQTIVTTYDLVRGTSFQTTYSYSSVQDSLQPNMEIGPLPQIPVESSVQYYNDLGATLLKTVSKTWVNERLLASQTTNVNNHVAKTTWNYNSNEMETEQDDYDFGTGAPGSFMRATVTNYQSFGSNHIVDHPSSVVVYSDANKTVKAAETDYTYDSPAGTATSGIVQHSGGCNCGSLTQSSQWLNSGGTTLSTTYTNDDTGQRLTMTGPRGAGHTTNYSYTDNYSSGNPPGPTNAYLTQITNALNQTQKFTYAYTSGEVTSSTDPNSQVTSYQYNDPGNLARLTETDFPTPDGGVTTIAYTDTLGSFSVETKHKIDSAGRWTDNIVLYNGLGLPFSSSTANDEATPWDRTDTCYDGNRRVLFSSYPYQASSATSAPNCSGTGDTMIYDALGRATQVSHSDGSTVLTTYTGGATRVQDEGNGNGTSRVTRVSQVDGLGRLLSVCEVTPYAVDGTGGTPAACGQDIAATGFLTSYSYNTLGDLLSVSQGALNQRSFSYDFASRLQTANNPESGTITYVYDTNPGSCPSVTYPFTGILASKLDARSVRTCYQYDGLDRVTQKNYSDGTPTAFFNFDQSSAYGVGLSYPIGHLTSQSTASPNPTGEIFSYDQLGRVKINSQCTPQNCSANTVFPVTYTYDLLGDTTSRTEGAGKFGRTLTYVVNKATRLTSLSSSLNDSTHPGLLFSAAHYNSAGSLLSASLGCVPTSCTINETRTYDARLRLASISDGSNYALTIPSSGGYAPDSDILAANDSVNGNWNYWYDDFNRLLGSSTNGSILNFDYDRFGNRWHQFQNDNCNPGQCFSFTGNNNRMDGYFYDASGNLLNDGTHNYYYDAESRIIQVDGPTLGACSTATACYVYNASGERVRKTTGSTSVDYLYDLASHEITELNSNGGTNRGEVYAGNRHVATYELGTTYLNFSDWLGTERLRTLATGVTCETITSLPFGDNQITSGSCADSSPMHFTGKQRDAESGLDNFGARYNSSAMGRFISTDPSNSGAVNTDPHSWNAYAYVRDNPVNLTDPTGEVFCRPTNEDEKAGGSDHVCDVSDATYVNSSKEQKAAYDKAGYKHYDCSCDSGADKDAWQHQNGNTSFDYIGAGLMFVLAVPLVHHIGQELSDGPAEAPEIMAKPTPAEQAMMQELREMGETVEQLPRIEGKKSADFLLNGVKTELKTLEGEGPNTVKNAIETAAEQGKQVLIDARGTNLTPEQAANQIARAQGNVGGLSGRVTILTKSGVVKF
jgi:RHS repeat-associated protein